MIPQALLGGYPITRRLYIQTTDLVASTDLSGTGDVDFTQNRSTDLVPILQPDSIYHVRGMFRVKRPGAATPDTGLRICRSVAVDQLTGIFFGSTRTADMATSLGWGDVGTLPIATSARIVLPSDINGNRRIQCSSATATEAFGFLGCSFYIDTGASACAIYIEPYSDSATAPVTMYAGSYIVVDRIS